MINNWKDLTLAVIDFIMGKTRYHRTYRYQVYADDSTDAKATLKRVDALADEPDVITIDKHYGSHGLSCLSQAGALVDVAFAAGDPGRPYVVAYYPGTLPKSLTLDADELIQIGTTVGHLGVQVHVGDTDLQPVARIGDNVNCGTLALIAIPPGGAFPAGGTQVAWTSPTNVLVNFGTLPVPFTPDPSTGGVVPIFGRINTGSGILKSQ